MQGQTRGRRQAPVTTGVGPNTPAPRSSLARGQVSWRRTWAAPSRLPSPYCTSALPTLRARRPHRGSLGASAAVWTIAIHVIQGEWPVPCPHCLPCWSPRAGTLGPSGSVPHKGDACHRVPFLGHPCIACRARRAPAGDLASPRVPGKPGAVLIRGREVIRGPWRCGPNWRSSCRTEPHGPRPERSTGPAGAATASPLLSVLAQQDADALVQRGPVGLVREEGQQVWSERWHLGARMTFTLGRKEAGDGPAGLTGTAGRVPG